jgi:Ca-activated chloride channel family protein
MLAHPFTAVLLLTVLLSSGQTQTASFAPMAPEQGSITQGNPTFMLEVAEVDLWFTARDRHNHWVTDLSEEDVRVLDNGQPPKSVIKFQSQVDMPLRVGLVIDTSDSVTNRLGLEESSAAHFLQQVLNPGKDLAFVVGFNKEPRLEQDLSSDTIALSRAIQNLHVGGTTALYDAVHYACEKLVDHAEAGPVRRVLIVLTDGEDNSSHFRADEAIAAAIRANVIVIALDTSEWPNPYDPRFKSFKEMAEVTGGMLLRADNKGEMKKALKDIPRQLRSHYLLAYVPAQLNQDGRYRKIQLQAKRHGLHMFYRRGYYAKSSAYRQEP